MSRTPDGTKTPDDNQSIRDAQASPVNGINDHNGAEKDVKEKTEPNDSEAETEILSRRQTPRKPLATNIEVTNGQTEAQSPSDGNIKVTKEPSSPLSSPKKRKAEELRGFNRIGAATSEEDEEDDIVVRRVRTKRARKTPQSDGPENGSGAEEIGLSKMRRGSAREDGSDKSSRREAHPSDANPPAHDKSKQNSLTALDLSTSLDNSSKADGNADPSQVQSPRLRSKFHRRSISLHPAAKDGQHEMSSRRFTKQSSRGSEGPPGERSSSQPATSSALPGVRVDAYGLTPFHKACKSGDEAKVRQMLEAPSGPTAQLSHPDYAGNTPLHSAALKGHADIVELLLKYNVDVNAVNKAADTPLQDATDNDHDDVIEILQRAGGTMADAKPSAENVPKHGTLYGDLTLKNLIKAIKDRDGDKAQAILSAGVTPNQDCVIAAIEANNIDMLNILPACGAPVDNIEDGKTPLVRAIEVGNNNAIQILLENGADASRHYPIGTQRNYWDLVTELKRKNWVEAGRVLRKAAGLDDGDDEQMQDAVDEPKTTDKVKSPQAESKEASVAEDEKSIKESSVLPLQEPPLVPVRSPSPPPSPIKDKMSAQATKESTPRPASAKGKSQPTSKRPSPLPSKENTPPMADARVPSPLNLTKQPTPSPVPTTETELPKVPTPSSASIKVPTPSTASMRDPTPSPAHALSPVKQKTPPQEQAKDSPPPKSPTPPSVPAKEPTPQPVPAKEPTPQPEPKPASPVKEPTPPPPLPSLPTGLAFALTRPMPPRYNETPFHILCLQDCYNPVSTIARAKLEQDCPLDKQDELWCPAFQISVILGHSNLQDVRKLLESRTAVEEPATMPLNLYWRQSLWQAIGLWQCMTRRYKYEYVPGSAQQRAAFAEREGFKHYRTEVDGKGVERFSVNYPAAIREEKGKWMGLEDGTQTYWVRWRDAQVLVEEAKSEGGRLSVFNLYSEGIRWPAEWEKKT